VRILLITLFFPPKYNAGTENYTLGLAKALISRGHEVQVLCAEDWQRGEAYWNGVTEDLYEDVPVIRIHLNWLKASNPNRVLYDSLKVEEWLDQFLLEQDIDLVHVVSTITLGVGVLRSVKRAGIPLVLTLTDFWFLCPSIQLIRSDGNLCDGKTSAQECQSCLLASSNLHKRIQKIPIPNSSRSNLLEALSHFPFLTKQHGFRGMLLNMNERKMNLAAILELPDLILSPSKFVQQMFMQNFQVSVHVLPHGHDLTWLADYHNKKPSNKLRFGYIGQIQPTKGIHILIDAFNQNDFGEKASLSIWGDLTKDVVYTQRIQELIGNHSFIRLCGRYDHEKLASVLADIDVLEVPSIWYENAPLVIQEAFAARTPVIATNLGGMAEAVQHEVNGLLFERGNVDDLARQMCRIYEENGLLDRLREGIPAVRTVDEELNELEMIYKNLIGQ
jgi:glycosyltransferase involved in cell wall biosynthesis